MLEVELLNVSQSTLSHLGLTVPTQIPVTALSAIGNAAPPQLSGPYATFGGGDSRFGIQIGNAGLQADWNQSDTRLLSSFRLRALEGLPASLHIGDRYPILTSRYSPIVLTDEIRKAQQQGPLLAPFPSFNFEDLGLVLKVTPRLHGDDEVSLALETEFRVLSGTSLNDLPIIASRRFNCTVRLREGEAGLVSGMAVAQVSRSWSGLWPFSRIPLLGRLLRANTSQRDQSELLLVIRPRLTRASPASQFPSRAYYTGTEGRAPSSL
jgi:general secretion pathway protein D